MLTNLVTAAVMILVTTHCLMPSMTTSFRLPRSSLICSHNPIGPSRIKVETYPQTRSRMATLRSPMIRATFVRMRSYVMPSICRMSPITDLRLNSLGIVTPAVANVPKSQPINPRLRWSQMLDENWRKPPFRASRRFSRKPMGSSRMSSMTSPASPMILIKRSLKLRIASRTPRSLSMN